MFDGFCQSSFEPAFEQGAWSTANSPSSRDSGGNSSLYYDHSEYPSFNLSADFDSFANKFNFSGVADTTETPATQDDHLNAIIDLPEYTTLTGFNRDGTFPNSRPSTKRLRYLNSSSLSDTSDSTDSFFTDAVSIALVQSERTGMSDKQASSAINRAGSNSTTIPHRDRLAFQPLFPQPAKGPARKPSPPRRTCEICQMSFSRLPDLRRHQQDLHERAKLIYKCNGCRHGKFGRLDKIQEHCRTQRHPGYSIVEISAHPDVVSALHSSQRRKRAKPFS